MQIKDLPSSSTLASTDVLAKDTNDGTTQKITGQDLAGQIKSLGNLLGTSDVVNNLTSGGTTVPLSAEMGKALNDAKVNVSDIVNDLTSTATDKPLSANMGKTLEEHIQQSTDVVELAMTTSPSGVVSTVGGKMYQVGKIVILDLEIGMTGSITSDWITVATLPRCPRDDVIINTPQDKISEGSILRTRIYHTDGAVKLFYGGSGNYHVHAVYPTV